VPDACRLSACGNGSLLGLYINRDIEWSMERERGFITPVNEDWPSGTRPFVIRSPRPRQPGGDLRKHPAASGRFRVVGAFRRQGDLSRQLRHRHSHRQRARPVALAHSRL
jgi:hypothetical protein